MEKILRYLTKDKLLINLILIIIFTAGLMSAFSIKQEALPAMEMDKMKISVIYPGASAKDVEMNAVIPIERELKKINGIDEFKTVCIESGASILIDLEQDLKNKQSVKDEIYRKITIGNIRDLPEEVEEFQILDLNPKLRAVYIVSIRPAEGADITDRKLFAFTDIFEDGILRARGVSDVQVSGYLDREIHINVEPGLMSKYYISLHDVVSSIKNRNVRSTGGTIQSIDKTQSIVSISQFEDPLEVRDVIVRSGFEQRRVYIKDIADVKDCFEKENIRVKVDNRKAVTLKIIKKEEADIVRTIDNVEKVINKFREDYSGLYEIETVSNEARSIKSMLSVVINNAVMGYILVFIVLLIFLDLRTSFWTALGIPVSLFITIFVMNKAGISINLLSLGAVITMVGILVDDGIVIAEVVYEKRLQGLNPVEAVVQGVKSVIKPVTVAIVTTIAAFLPMLAVTGTMGKFIFQFPVIITIILLASLFEATVLLPSHLAHNKPLNKKKAKDRFALLAEKYRILLIKILKYRYITALSFVAFLIASFFISSGSIKNFVLMYDDSSEIIFINMEAPRGVSLDKCESLTARILDEVTITVPEKDRISVITTIGKHTASEVFSQGEKENLSEVKIILIPATERDIKATEYVRLLKSEINEKKFPEFESIMVKQQLFGPPAGSAVDVKIVSKNGGSPQIQRKLEDFLAGIPGVINIDNDQKKGKEELKLDFNYKKLADYGMNVASIASTVRTAYEGTVATSIQTYSSDERLDFRVRMDEKTHRDVSFLKNLLVPNSQNRLIRLGDIAGITRQEGESLINHFNGEKIITVTADVDTSLITSRQINEMIKNRFSGISAEYPGSYLIFSGESKETGKSLGGLAVSYITALLLIYFILILLYRSVSLPALIMSIIPFGITGALLAFAAHGIPLSFMGIIGIIGLSGVVVNDSIIMVDFINNSIKKNPGLDRDTLFEKISQAARQRLKPVILTTVTTVAGLMPTVYGIGGDAGTLVPTVMAIAYGILFATFLTLFLIPSFYMINADAGILISKISSRIKSLLKPAGKEGIFN